MRQHISHIAKQARQIATRWSVFAGLLFYLTAAALAAPLSQTDNGHKAVYSGLSMGTLVQAQLYADKAETAEQLVQLFEQRLAEYDTLWTVHRSGPLNEVNRLSGQWVDVDCRIARLVAQAKRLAQESDRAFEPTIGTLVNTWKIGFGGKHRPEQSAIDAALEKVDYRRVEVQEHPQACRVRIASGQSLDLGAIAKGWIGTAIAQELKRAGATHGIIDLGGNVTLIACNPSGKPWRVGVQNPAQERGMPMAVIAACDVSVITSGAYERKLEDAKTGKKYGHILSAVTGEPVDTDIGSVTIVDADGAKADGWCTALFAMGTQRAVALMQKRPDIAAVIVSDDLKRVWVSQSIAEAFRMLTDATVTVVRTQ